MRWRGRRNRNWLGRGPFSYLPPWQRPGWLYGKGACWRLVAPHLQTTTLTDPESTTVPPIVPETPLRPALTKEQEIQMLEQQTNFLQSQQDAIRKRLEELEKTGD